MVSSVLHGDEWREERRSSRHLQRLIELRRLEFHRLIGQELIADPIRRDTLLASAWNEVRRWEDMSLCSPDYIEWWRQWLARPVAELVTLMCSDAEGWGTAMRQNSPFLTAPSGTIQA